MKRRRPEIADRWKLHHDNAPSYTAFHVKLYLVRIVVSTLPQPPYSPDLSPVDFFLFPKLKTTLLMTPFDDVAAIQKAVTTSLKGILEADFEGTYKSWKSRWQRCIDT
jgi:histone-lysine N-methyltransferase SETMAR